MVRRNRSEEQTALYRVTHTTHRTEPLWSQTCMHSWIHGAHLMLPSCSSLLRLAASPAAGWPHQDSLILHVDLYPDPIPDRHSCTCPLEPGGDQHSAVSCAVTAVSYHHHNSDMSSNTRVRKARWLHELADSDSDLPNSDLTNFGLNTSEKTTRSSKKGRLDEPEVQCDDCMFDFFLPQNGSSAGREASVPRGQRTMQVERNVGVSTDSDAQTLAEQPATGRPVW